MIYIRIHWIAHYFNSIVPIGFVCKGIEFGGILRSVVKKVVPKISGKETLPQINGHKQAPPNMTHYPQHAQPTIPALVQYSSFFWHICLMHRHTIPHVRYQTLHYADAPMEYNEHVSIWACYALSMSNYLAVTQLCIGVEMNTGNSTQLYL